MECGAGAGGATRRSLWREWNSICERALKLDAVFWLSFPIGHVGRSRGSSADTSMRAHLFGPTSTEVINSLATTVQATSGHPSTTPGGEFALWGGNVRISTNAVEGFSVVLRKTSARWELRSCPAVSMHPTWPNFFGGLGTYTRTPIGVTVPFGPFVTFSRSSNHLLCGRVG